MNPAHTCRKSLHPKPIANHSQHPMLLFQNGREEKNSTIPQSMSTGCAAASSRQPPKELRKMIQRRDGKELMCRVMKSQSADRGSVRKSLKVPLGTCVRLGTTSRASHQGDPF